MSRKCNNYNLITYSDLKSIKDPAPILSAISFFEFFVYTSKHNKPCIPEDISISDSEILFDLFFD